VMPRSLHPARRPEVGHNTAADEATRTK
jgi:hypothetical protein